MRHALTVLFPAGAGHVEVIDAASPESVTGDGPTGGGTGVGERVVGVELPPDAAARDRALERATAPDVQAAYGWTADAAESLSIASDFRKAGFDVVERYGADPDYYFALVPLDQPGAKAAARFALALKPAPGLKGKLKHRLKAALVSLGRDASLYEGFLVVATRGRSATGMPPRGLRHLIDDAMTSAGASATTRCLLPLSSNVDDHGNDLVLVFEGEPTPASVLKLARNASYGAKIVNEARLLDHVASSSLAAQIPRHLASGEVAGRPYLIQSGLGGEAQAKLLRSGPISGAVSSVGAGMDALITLTQLKAGPAAQPPARWNSIEGVPEAGGDTDLQAALTRLDAALVGRRFVVHGDFWPTNLFFGGGSRLTGIIDWEFGSTSAPYPSDVAWYLINAAYLLNRRDRPSATIEQAFASTFFDGDAWTGVMAKSWKRWCDAAEFEPGLAAALFRVTLHQLAARESSAYGTSGTMDAVCRELLKTLAGSEATFKLAG